MPAPLGALVGHLIPDPPPRDAFPGPPQSSSQAQSSPSVVTERSAVVRRSSVISSNLPLKLESGSQIGSYQILGPLGSGGMGEVYRARDAKLDRDIALKILAPEMGTSSEHLRRFEQEARAASALNHPNIITIYEIGTHRDVSYIAMELVDGESLRDLMDHGPIPLANALRIAAKVADGLAAAHERGIVHRDLKPENLMISRDGFVKVLDFGLAKLTLPGRAEGPTMPLTTPGVVFGTISYMSPEQARGRPVDGRSDQFSVGVILYEMLCRARPFDRDSIGDTMAAIIRDEPVPPSQINSDVPPDLEAVIDRCLSKDRDDRYDSTRELAHELRDIRNRLTLGTHPGTASRRLPTPSKRAKRPVPISAILSIVAGVLLLGAGGFFIARREAAPLAGGAPKSLAIIPFHDSGGTAEGQVFSDGISQTISARLTEAPNLRVFTPFDGAGGRVGTDPVAIAKKTGAELMLKGVVQRVGQELRVTYSIIDLQSGAQVGSKTINGSVADVFTLEDTIAERILRTLGAAAPRVTQTQQTGLQNPLDQRAYTEALGLLQKPRDVKAIEDAISKLEMTLVNARDSAEVNALLGTAYMAKWSMTHQIAVLEQGKLYAERAVQLDASNARAHSALAAVLLATGKAAQAITEYQRASQLQPTFADPLVGLGVSYARAGRAADAEKSFERAIELRPDSSSAFNTYGRFALDRGKFDLAARLYQRVTELLPDSSRGFANLGAALQSGGRYEEAMRAYQRSLQIAPNATAWSNIGGCQFSLGQYAISCTAFRKATELSPNDYTLWMNLGDGYRWTPGQKKEADAAYARAVATARNALQVNPQDVLARAVAASALAKSGHPTEAKHEIDEALKLDPTNANVLYQAAVISVIRSERDSALMWAGRAVSAGYPPADASRDPELSSLRKDPAFLKTISGPRSNS
jgi:serine/threonine protein kinase/tetratricopeptide (TPR) repeat protein